MSHEIRTPLNSIIGMMELIMIKPLDTEQLAHAVSVKDASLSLLQIINDILDLSKIDSDKMEISRDPFNFASLINDTINLVNVKAADVGIPFITDISPNIPAVITGDLLRIKQVLINLFNNSIKFTEKGYILFKASSEILEDGKLKLLFSVEDTGIGIRKDDIGKLFGEFEQFDTRDNKALTGTGLGLAITRKYVELMGGRISAESEYGRGSKFSFYIICDGHYEGRLAALTDPSKYKVLLYEPNIYHAESSKTMFSELDIDYRIARTEAEFKNKLFGGGFTHVFFDAEVESLVEIYSEKDKVLFTLVKNINDMSSLRYPVNFLNRPMFIVNIARILEGNVILDDFAKHHDGVKLGAFKVKDIRVLLVDDHPANLIVAEGMIKQYGIDVQTVNGGQEAIDAAAGGDFDIIFMDHMMPSVDGIAATKAIRRTGKYSQVIIALSANAVTGAREMFLEAGMDDFISKPIIINDLHRILLKYIPPEKIIVTATGGV
jgi:CheY-like chemotaxis protein